MQWSTNGKFTLFNEIGSAVYSAGSAGFAGFRDFYSRIKWK